MNEKTDGNPKDVFTRIENHGFQLNVCPICGSAPELWERCEEDKVTGDIMAHKAVMCSNGDPIGPSKEGCPLYMPPEQFYLGRRVEAVYFWNAFCVAAANMAKKKQRERIK